MDPRKLTAVGPLADILVLDLSRVVAGPYAAMLLGDAGARVIKVERPGGDDTRHWGPPFVGGGERESTYFLSINRNKESIVLDLKDPADRSTCELLVRRADVLIENFRPGVMGRLGLDHARLLELNPQLVVLSITAYGHDGPEADRSGYDQLVQGEAGIMSLTGPTPDEPTKVGVPVADVGAGMLGAFAVVAALHERKRTGRGQIVRTSLLAGAVAMHAFQATRWLVGSELPQANGNRHPTVAPYGAFRCKDGLIQICCGNEVIWQRLAPLVGVDPDDERFRLNEDRLTNYAQLAAIIEAALAKHPVADWLRLFDEQGVPAGKIRTLDDVYSWPQLISQELVVEMEHPTLGPVRLPGSPVRFDAHEVAHTPPPTLGQHSEAIRSLLETELFSESS